jgi:hypothetical protein
MTAPPRHQDGARPVQRSLVRRPICELGAEAHLAHRQRPRHGRNDLPLPQQIDPDIVHPFRQPRREGQVDTKQPAGLHRHLADGRRVEALAPLHLDEAGTEARQLRGVAGRRRLQAGQAVLQRQDLAAGAARQQSLQRLAGRDRVVGRHIVERLPPGIEPEPHDALLAHHGLARGRAGHDHHDLAGRVEHAEQQDTLALKRRGDRHAGPREIHDQVGRRGLVRHGWGPDGVGRPADGRPRPDSGGRLQARPLGQGSGRADENGKAGKETQRPHGSTSRLPSE